MKIRSSVFVSLLSVATGLLLARAHADKSVDAEKPAPLLPTAADLALAPKVVKSEAEWKAELSLAQYAVLRGKSTERAFSSALLHEHRRGVFICAACGAPLFASDGKFDSGTGWPSFTKPFLAKATVTKKDHSFWMERDEVRCARCGSHLGHVFDDGPAPTGLRYCINGVALKFEERP
jgi:peptide-methionine (R)-S-oxide reductase